jgi:hypothetical protein
MNLMFAEWANRGLNLWTVAQSHDGPDAGHRRATRLAPDVVDILEMVAAPFSGTDYEVERISRGEYLDFPEQDGSGPSRRSSTSTGKISAGYHACGRRPRTRPIRWCTTMCAGSKTLTPCRTRPASPVPFPTPAWWLGLAYYLAMKRAPERAADDEGGLRRRVPARGQRR